MSDPNILYVCPECSEKLYPNKGKFTVEQLLKADMVKSAFSAGKRVEHMWVKVSEVQVENQLVKGTLDNTPTEITHLTFGDIVFVPFKYIEDIWIEGQVPESVKRLLEIKEEELKAEEFVRSLFEGVETISSPRARRVTEALVAWALVLDLHNSARVVSQIKRSGRF